MVAALAFATAAVRASGLEVWVRDAEGRPVADAVVFVDSAILAPPAMLIDQIDKRFVPQVSAVPTGTSVSFPNSDDIKHHVYSFSPAKTFELKLYHGMAAAPVVFDRPGLVTLGCNIHDGMVAYLYVVPSTQYALTDAAGYAKLPTATSDGQQVTAWHHQMSPDLAQGGVSSPIVGADAQVALTLPLLATPNLPPPLE